MIIYSITTALEESIEEKWVEFMKNDHIPLIMKTGLFKDFRFVRVIPGQGVDISYNLQLRCSGHPELNQYRGMHEKMLESIIQKHFEGKYASFQSVLEHVAEGND